MMDKKLLGIGNNMFIFLGYISKMKKYHNFETQVLIKIKGSQILI